MSERRRGLALLAIDDALKAARDLVEQLTRARGSTQVRDYTKARSLISDAVNTASYLDHHYLRNAGTALRDCQ